MVADLDAGRCAVSGELMGDQDVGDGEDGDGRGGLQDQRRSPMMGGLEGEKSAWRGLLGEAAEPVAQLDLKHGGSARNIL
jgi:hypothetical protein